MFTMFTVREHSTLRTVIKDSIKLIFKTLLNFSWLCKEFFLFVPLWLLYVVFPRILSETFLFSVFPPLSCYSPISPPIFVNLLSSCPSYSLFSLFFLPLSSLFSCFFIFPCFDEGLPCFLKNFKLLYFAKKNLRWLDFQKFINIIILLTFSKFSLIPVEKLKTK